MKKYVYLILFSAIFSCQKSGNSILLNQAIIKGNVATGSNKIQINFSNKEIELSLDENGNFRDTISVSSPQYVDLSFGNLSCRIYLSNGDEVDIAVDSTISFGGSNSHINTYLFEYTQNDIERREREHSRHEQIYNFNEVEYVNFRDSIRAHKLARLKKLPSGTKEFQDFHKKDIEFQYQYDVAKYPNYYSWFFNDYVPTTIISDFYENVNLDDEVQAQNYSGYRALVDLILEKQIQDLIEKGYSPLDANLAVIKDISSPTILHRRLNRALYFFTFEAKNIEATKQKMLALAKQDRTKNIIMEHYKVINRLKPGSPAPAFNLENYKEGKTNLADLKGKYVYIDVWATWCGPCLKEIPFLKNVEKEFEHSNIVFVSISLDEAKFYNNWREMVKMKELGGIQLIVENGWDSNFTKDYGIRALPRFILLDDEGNFISADVEKPSDPKLKDRLYSLGI